jgi:hypothetical protein
MHIYKINTLTKLIINIYIRHHGIQFVSNNKVFTIFCHKFHIVDLLLTGCFVIFAAFSHHIYTTVWICHTECILSLVDGYLGCFYFSAVTKNDICVQVFLGHMFLFLVGIYLDTALLCHVVTVFNILSNCQTVFQSNCSNLQYHQ